MLMLLLLLILQLSVELTKPLQKIIIIQVVILHLLLIMKHSCLGPHLSTHHPILIIHIHK